MSEFGYDEQDQVDPNLWAEAVKSIADEAAQQATQNTVGYLQQQQAAQLAASQQQLATATAAQADAALEAKYGDAWRNDRAEVGRRIAAKPGLIAEQNYFSPSGLANDLDAAYELAQIESKREAEQARKRADDDFFAGVQKAHQKTWAQRMAETGQSVHDVLESDAG